MGEIDGRFSAGRPSGTDGANYTKTPPPFKGGNAEVIDSSEGSPEPLHFLQHCGGEL